MAGSPIPACIATSRRCIAAFALSLCVFPCVLVMSHPLIRSVIMYLFRCYGDLAYTLLDHFYYQEPYRHEYHHQPARSRSRAA